MAPGSAVNTTALAKELVELCSSVKDAPRSDRAASQGTIRTHLCKELCEKAEDRYEDRSIDESLLLGLEALALAAAAYGGPKRKLARDRAIRSAKQALEHFKGVGNELGEALGMNAVARLQLLRERPEMAIRLATEASGKFLAMCSRRAEAYSLCIIIDAHVLKATLVAEGKFLRQSRYLKLTPTEREEELQALRSKHLDDALQEVSRVTELFGEVREKRGKADLLCTVADIHMGRGSFDDAKEAAMLARDAFHDLDDRRGEQLALLLELDAHIADKDGREALDVAHEIVKLFRKAKDRKGEIEGLLTQIRVHQLAAQHSEVARLVAEIRALCKEEGDSKLEGQAVDALMQTHLQSGNVDEAIKTADEAIEIYRRSNDRSGEATALHACSCLRLDQFFEQVEKDLADFKLKGCLQQYYKEVDVAAYEESRGQIMKAIDLFKQAGDKRGLAMAEETLRSVEERATMLNDPDETKQIFKDGKVVEVIRTWNPKPRAGDPSSMPIANYAG